LNSKNYTAIAIGTSAGGMFALSAILEKLPVSYPLPIMIVQHRAKSPKELLEDVLRRKCRIHIKQADEKESIEGGTVYIAPPDYHLLVENDKTFSLSSDEYIRYSRPSINVLFETAAIVFRDTLIGIILTGANNDGAEGISMIKKYGGLTIAQHPDDAQFPFMPRASIETNNIQYIWTLSEIQNFLLKISNA
jgi:two-component system, chemotaxis family, protein-glutamate methylesterase/glutaminase